MLGCSAVVALLGGGDVAFGANGWAGGGGSFAWW